MRTRIFHSVNGGLYLWGDGMGLLVDGIHQGRDEGFSSMPVEITEQLRKGSGLFAHLDGLLFTHLHGDHFDPKGLRLALSGPRPPLLYGTNLPVSTADVQPVAPGVARVRMGRADVLTLVTKHDGHIYRNDPHQSFLICLGGEGIFIAGDALLTREDAKVIAQSFPSPVAAAFVNPYQALSDLGREFLRQLMPKRIFLYHLPFVEDDQHNLYRLARQTVRRFPPDLSHLERLDLMAWVDGEAAAWPTEQTSRKGA